MAKLFITTDAVVISNPATILASVDIVQDKVVRIRVALGHFDNSIPPVWIDATAQDVMDQLKSFLKGSVIEYDTAIAANIKRGQVGGEIW